MRIDIQLITFALKRLREWWIDFIRFGRLVKPDPDLLRAVPPADKMKVALVCIAKDEDNYIEEWIAYHLKLGVDEIYIYQNDWRAKLRNQDSCIHLMEFDGSCRQLPAYDDFIHNHSTGFDFAIFIDVDEFICLVKDKSIKEFLSRYSGYGAVGLNWRLFGDSGFKKVVDNDYSLLRRFTRCGRKLNRHIKTVLNLHAVNHNCDCYFASPHHLKVAEKGHFTVSTDMRHYISGPICSHFDYELAWINHYHSKTIEEFKNNKCRKGRSDCERDSEEQNIPMKTFEMHNQNEVINTIARDFYDNSFKECEV